MKAKFGFKLGNRGLFPEELGIVERVNCALDASARRHGIALKPAARIVVHVSCSSSGSPVYQVAAAGQAPVPVPLAPGLEPRQKTSSRGY